MVVEVRKSASAAGLGIFCSSSNTIEEGDTVFEDVPLFSLQHTANRRMCTNCAHCARFVGGLPAQLETMFAQEEHFQPLLEKLMPFVPKWQQGIEEMQQREQGLSSHCRTMKMSSSMVRCACGEVYCSEACRLAHWQHSHELLCVASNASSSLVDFKMHAIEHIDTMLLVATVFSHLIQRVKQSIFGAGAGGYPSSSSSCASARGGGHADAVGGGGGNAESMRSLMEELLGYCGDEFLKVCRPPPGRPKDEEFMEETKAILSTGFQMLRTHFAETFSANNATSSGSSKEVLLLQHELEVLFASEEFFLRVLGMFEVNNLDLEVESDIGNFFGAYFAANPAVSAEEKEAYEMLLRERELLMRCLYDDEMTGNFDVEDDDEEEEDEDEEDVDVASGKNGDDVDVEGGGATMEDVGVRKLGAFCSQNADEDLSVKMNKVSSMFTTASKNSTSSTKGGGMTNMMNDDGSSSTSIDGTRSTMMDDEQEGGGDKEQSSINGVDVKGSSDLFDEQGAAKNNLKMTRRDPIEIRRRNIDDNLYCCEVPSDENPIAAMNVMEELNGGAAAAAEASRTVLREMRAEIEQIPVDLLHAISSSSSADEVTRRKLAEEQEKHNVCGAGWPSYHGTAFSAKIARCNHNCTPNMKFFFNGGDHRMRAKALRRLVPGEEIFVCYCEDSDPVERRQKALREYGFECRCDRCLREMATMNTTSKATKAQAQNGGA
ncbi:unnamed protein product [Amoebophrya sp. A25]|nr:unnamed protein product [Amoebophrya sp. A25]|eukprot:GSA25T00010951001.1